MMSRATRPIAVVTGMIATYPVGGVVWDYGQYALGLERLGFDVYYLEDTNNYTYDPRLRKYTEDPSFGAHFLPAGLAALSPTLAKRWHLRAVDGRSFGMEPREFRNVIRDARIFLNVSGGAVVRDEYRECPNKVLIDTDPGRNHFRDYPRMERNPEEFLRHGFRAHDHFFTYAERMGQPDCVLPTFGLHWQPTRPPVVLDCWASRPPGSTWTTVMTWSNRSEPLEYQGVHYGDKEMEFKRIEDLPRQVDARLEIAAGGTDRPDDAREAAKWGDPLAGWKSAGWHVIDAADASRTADSYRAYVEQSRGEFSVAKNVYAATRSGWFSCRTACYLASGRPAVVQDTGFSAIIPAIKGLVAFSDFDGAVAGISGVERDYSAHAAAARRIAEEYLDARLVLTDLLSRIGLEKPRV